MLPYEQGYIQTMYRLGITKEASGAGFLATKVLPKLKGFGKTVKEMAVGNPIQASKQIMSGQGLAKGSLIRQGFHPGKGVMGAVGGGLFYGLPAYEGYKIMKSDAPNKGEQMGKLLGGAALGLGTWRAYGMLGSMLASQAGERIGGTVGRLGQRAVHGEPQAQPQAQPQGAPQYYRAGMPAAYAARRMAGQ